VTLVDSTFSPTTSISGLFMGLQKSLCERCGQWHHADEVIWYGKNRICLECIEAERRHRLYNEENTRRLRARVAELRQKPGG
jgi:hypothetical protein